MKTFFAKLVSKKKMDPKAVKVLEEDCRAYNAMLPAALKIELSHKKGDEESVFVKIRKRFPSEKYCKKYNLVRHDKTDQLHAVATNPIAHGLEADAKQMANTAKGMLDQYISDKEDCIKQMEKKIKKEEKWLNDLLLMKSSLIERSKAAKEGKAIPKFNNRLGRNLKTKMRKGEDGKYVTVYTIDYGNGTRKHPSKPIVFENEYLFEVQYLDAKIKCQKQRIGRIRDRIHKTQQERRNLIRDKELGKVHVCIGSRKLFHKQHNTPTYQESRKKDPRKKLNPPPTAADDKVYHDKWLAEYRAARNRSMFFIGCKARSSGNDVIKYNPYTHDLLYISTHGEKVVVPNVLFRYGAEIIKQAVTANYGQAMTVQPKKMDLSYYNSPLEPVSVSWCIKDLGRRFLITCSLEEPKNEYMNTSYSDGCIGFDMNWNNIAIAEIDANGEMLLPPVFKLDEKGEPILPPGLTRTDLQHIQLEPVLDRETGKPIPGIKRMKRVVYIRTEHRSSSQIDSDISSALEHAFVWAKLRNKPISMEDIESIKTAQLYRNPGTNGKVSMFAHSKMTALAENKSQKYGIGIKKVNPAFTSQIAKFKYMRKYGLSIHECAAYTIARRGIGLAETVPNDMIGVLPQKTKDTILEKADNAREWSYWSALSNGFKNVPISAFYRKIEYSKYESQITALKKHLIAITE